MVNTNNKSYNRIIEYIKTYGEVLSTEDKRYLIHYASRLLHNGLENLEVEDFSDILNDIKVYNAYLKDCKDTTVVIDRIERELELIEMINDYHNGVDNKNKIAYDLDRLYLESDLGIRRTSSLAYTLEKTKENSSKVR